MPLGKDYDHQDCAIARALEVVGERWTLLVLRDCFFGVRRFTDLLEHLDIPRAVLTDRLGTLVEAGVLRRQAYRPGRDEYLLTDAALPLWPALFALGHWGELHRPPHTRRRFSHVDCGTDVDPAGRCPSCDTLPGPADLVVRPGRPHDHAHAQREDPVSRALRHPHRLLTPLTPRDETP